MAGKRYQYRTTFKNESENYESLFRKRSVESIQQYDTAKFSYPTDEEYYLLNVTKITWKMGDRLYKIAYEYYNDPTLWWIVAWFNKKPTENHFEIGDEVLIPMPLEKLFKYFKN